MKSPAISSWLDLNFFAYLFLFGSRNLTAESITFIGRRALAKRARLGASLVIGKYRDMKKAAIIFGILMAGAGVKVYFIDWFIGGAMVIVGLQIAFCAAVGFFDA